MIHIHILFWSNPNWFIWTLYRNMGDKVRRAINYLFNQASFYPLNPSSDRICLDAGLSQNFAAMPTVPNILIISSSIKAFIRVRRTSLDRGALRRLQNANDGILINRFRTWIIVWLWILASWQKTPPVERLAVLSSHQHPQIRKRWTALWHVK